MVAAIVQEIRPVALFLVNDRHKKIGRKYQYAPAESRRRYTDDGERMLVELHNTAHNAAIILKWLCQYA